jgi:FkbM family methyltransferase
VIRQAWKKLKGIPRARLARSRKLRSEGGRTLYRSRQGVEYWLDPTRWIDRNIIETGVFEPRSTEVVEELVSPGDVVLDVGANIGYFTLLLSRLVGERGRVIAFEPTRLYGDVLQKNLESNRVANCSVESVGLSSEEAELMVSIGESSATLHWWVQEAPRERELVRLVRLDDIAELLELDRLDFIKVDIDGHEPFFFEGAWQTLERFRPRILMEVNAQNYQVAGITPSVFYDTLKDRGLHVYSENDLSEYESQAAFLYECGNYTHSANMVVSFDPLKGLVG